MPVGKKSNMPFDTTHLARQTMGDKVLEGEIVALFAIQCENCEKSLGVTRDKQSVSEIAHQMKGCAKAVGAGQISQTACELEKSPDNGALILRLRDLCHNAKRYIDLTR